MDGKNRKDSGGKEKRWEEARESWGESLAQILVASLQPLEMITQSYFPLCASLLKSSFCWSVSSGISDQIQGPCWRFPRLQVLQQSLQCQTLPLQAAILSHSQLCCDASLKAADGSWLGGTLKSSYLQCDATKGQGFYPPVPQCQCWVSFWAQTQRGQSHWLFSSLFSTGLHHLALHWGASCLDDPPTDHLMAVSCRLAGSHV